MVLYTCHMVLQCFGFVLILCPRGVFGFLWFSYGVVLLSYGFAMFSIDFNCLPSLNLWCSHCFLYGFQWFSHGFAILSVDSNRLPSPELRVSYISPMVLQGLSYALQWFLLILMVSPHLIACFLMFSFMV